MRKVQEFTALWTDEVLKDLDHQSDVFGDAVAQSLFDFMGLKRGEEMTEEEEKAHRAKWGAYMARLATQDYFEEPEKPPLERRDGGFMALQTPIYSYYVGPSFPITDANLGAISGLPNKEILSTEEQNYTLTPEREMLLNRASRFFERNGPAVIMVLACRSLLKQYASGNTSELLGRTRLLIDFPHRRIIETMQFVMDVMQPEWSKQDATILKDENGIASLQTLKKLRITHAMIRTRVAMGRQKFLDEDKAKLSGPINQQEMIMANLTFSLEVIEGLRSLNIEVSEEEQNDFFKAWLYIGDLLGIKYPKGLKPETYEEAWALQNKLYNYNFKKNEFGPQLAHALLNWLEDILPMTDRQAILDIIEEINKDDDGSNKKILEDILEIDFDCGPQSRKKGMLAGLIRKLRNRSKTANRTFFQELFHNMVNELLGLERGGKERRFSIIAGFEESWNLTPKARYQPISQWSMLAKMIKALFQVTWRRFLRMIGIK